MNGAAICAELFFSASGNRAAQFLESNGALICSGLRFAPKSALMIPVFNPKNCWNLALTTHVSTSN
jgi:hypothetical protein